MAGGPVDQIKGRLDIADVVSEKVSLKKAGRTLKGLCPFHTEKTPSFIVFPETGTWKCFGCGAGGDMFSFVMQSQNLDFSEALALLAARAGVELRPERVEKKNVEVEDRLYAINEAATAYFRSMLAGPAGTRTRAYLQDRSISAESSESFRLGFAPDAGAGLAHHLMNQGYARADLLAAGLAGENETGGLYDRFRGRLIFPISDGSGKVVGFGGRSLSPEVQPKYLNTPQTPLFDKGGCLYALDKARAEIKEKRQAVIVEGYVDALMAHQHGFRNVVAALGTAVTERQVAQLKRLAGELLFALDPDTAGQDATARGLSVAMDALDREAAPLPTWRGFIEYVYKLKTVIKIISLPSGKDPDQLIQGNPAEWERLIAEAAPVQDFFLNRVKTRHDLSTPAGKSAAVEEAMGVIASIPDPVQQAHYVQRLATLVGIEEAFLLQQMRQRRRRRPKAGEWQATERGTEPGSDAESHCLALIVMEPRLVEVEPKLSERSFHNPGNREIFLRLAEMAKEGEDFDAGALMERLRAELGESLQPALAQVAESLAQYEGGFEESLEHAYRSAAVSVLASDLALRKREFDAMQASADGEAPDEEAAELTRLSMQIAADALRLQKLGGILPLRAIHKEVRHGG